jgi:3'-5' exonuclease
MKPSVIVWDLETVPDLAGFAAANDLVGKPEADIREALGNKFPKHIYHTIVCIGTLVAHREGDHWAVDALGAPHVGERTEKQLIATFCDKIAELKPQLVTFNGSSFDLPVLRYRAMIHGISAPGLAVRPYFNRYTEDAVDLCDILSSFAPHTKASLNETRPSGQCDREGDRPHARGSSSQGCCAGHQVSAAGGAEMWLAFQDTRQALARRRGGCGQARRQADEACAPCFGGCGTRRVMGRRD